MKLFVSRCIDGLAQPLTFPGVILTIMACVALASLPIYNGTLDLMGGVVRMFSRRPWRDTSDSTRRAITMLAMIPTAFFCDITLLMDAHPHPQRGG